MNQKIMDAITNYTCPGAVDDHEVRVFAQYIAMLAWREAETTLLKSIVTTAKAAILLGRSRRRVLQLIKARKVGFQLDNGEWLLRPEEVWLLQPGKPGRPRKVAQ